jgi:hypothetical protein
MPRHRMFFAAILLATANFAQPAPSVDAHVVLQISLLNEQREFRIGEIIPLRIWHHTAERSGGSTGELRSGHDGRIDQFPVFEAGAVDDSSSI